MAFVVPPKPQGKLQELPHFEMLGPSQSQSRRWSSSVCFLRALDFKAKRTIVIKWGFAAPSFLASRLARCRNVGTTVEISGGHQLL